MGRAPRRARLSPSLDDLQLYCHVCDGICSDRSTSFHEIAKVLGRSVSAISECITRLQNNYGVTLIDRTERKTGHVLTPEGRNLFERGKRLLADHGALGGAGDIDISVGTTNNLLVHLIAESVAQFRGGDYGNAKLRFNETEYPQILEDLWAGRIHFGLSWELPGRSFPDVEIECFKQKIDIVFVCHRSHVIAQQFLNGKRSEIRLEELGSHSLIVVHPGYQPGFEKLPLPNRLLGGDRIELSLYSSVLTYVRMGLGVGIYPGWYWELERMPELFCTRIKGVEQRRIAAFLPPGGRKALPTAARSLLEAVEKHLKGLRLSRR